jgi:hypothetical protein
MITNEQDIPVAQNQSVTLWENIAAPLTLNATDPWGTALTYSIVTQPTHGTLGTLVSNAATYTPNSSFTGSDSFNFQAYNGTNYSANVGTVMLAVISSCIIDDSSASGFSTTGTWTAATVAGGYLGNLHYAAASTSTTAPSATATWTFNVAQGGNYQVAATWYANSNRATNAPFSIDGTTPVLVNQQVAPSGVSYNGAVWQVLKASYAAISNTLTVKLSNTANGYVIADAVMITLVTNGTPPPAPGPAITITSPAQATPNSATLGAEVVLSVAASEVGASLSYAWEFGDGQSGSGQAVTHSYSAAGQYTATVTISDGRGNQAATSVKVLVER